MNGQDLFSRAMPLSTRPSGGGLGMRLLIGLFVAGGAIFSYLNSSSVNTITGETQHVKISPEQEIAIGLQSAPQMAAQYGGLAADPKAQALVDAIGKHLVRGNAAIAQSGYPIECHALADEKTINAFALPGGQTFITMALLRRLESEGQIAGVLGHEIGHVVARHSAQQMAQQELTQGLTGAAVMATYDPDNPNTQHSAQVAMMIGNLVNTKYGRDDELEADRLGVKFMSEAGYDPRSMIRVMEILAESSGGGQRQPEFLSTHPNPENRIGRIKEAIQKYFPNGVPKGLKP